MISIIWHFARRFTGLVRKQNPSSWLTAIKGIGESRSFRIHGRLSTLLLQFVKPPVSSDFLPFSRVVCWMCYLRSTVVNMFIECKQELHYSRGDHWQSIVPLGHSPCWFQAYSLSGCTSESNKILYTTQKVGKYSTEAFSYHIWVLPNCTRREITR